MCVCHMYVCVRIYCVCECVYVCVSCMLCMCSVCDSAKVYITKSAHVLSLLELLFHYSH